MREYKFRGKRKDNGEWGYGCYVSTSPDEAFILIGVTGHIKRDDYECYMVPVRPESVGMWTGLKDKNGVDVYMGDVIRIKHRNKIDSILGPIVGFVNMDIPYGGMFVDCGDSDYMELGLDKHYIYEILGNRIDNPELLTPADKTAKI